MIKIKSALIDKNQSIDGGIINEKNWSDLEYVIRSDKSF